jgi:outer membrane protein TolC
MLFLIKVSIVFFIFSISSTTLSAEEISEQTFFDSEDLSSSYIKGIMESEKLVSMELAELSLKSTGKIPLKSSLKENKTNNISEADYNSEQTFVDKDDQPPSPTKEIINSEPLMSTELSDHSLKSTDKNSLKSSLKENKGNNTSKNAEEISEQTFFERENKANKTSPKIESNANSMILSLKDAIIRTLSNNVSIAVESFDSKVKKESILDSLSEFDVTLDIELSTGRKTQQLASAFSSPNRMENDSDNWDLSLSQKLVSGANYQFDFTNNRNKTNSKTAGLNPSYNSEFELHLTQPLLKNFGTSINKRNINIAKNEVDISDYDFKTKVIDVISDVESTYWDYVLNLKDLEVKQKSLDRAKDLERRVKIQVFVGTMAPIETLQAESEVASREEFLLSAKDAIEDNQDKLKNILNIDFSSPEGLLNIHPSSKADIFVKNVDFNETVKIALSSRADYLGKQKELENKDILVKYQENQIYPSIDLVGSLGVNGLSGDAVAITSGTFQGKSAYGGGYGTALTDSLSTNYYDWELGVKFSYPLGNRSAKSKLSASRLEKAKLILDIKNLEKQIILEVRESVRQLQTDTKRIKAASIAKKLAEEKLKAEEKKFEVGLSTSFNVLEFQEDLAQAQSNEIKTIIDYKQSRIRFRKIIASTLNYHNVKLPANESS